MTPFHVLIVVWPVGEVVIALHTGIRTLAGVLSSMSLINLTSLHLKSLKKNQLIRKNLRSKHL